jgi:hypothetical protein
MLTGGCYCGDIRYVADGPAFHACFCHCTICRRTTGAPVVAWFSVRRTGFRLLSGAPVRFASSAAGSRSFCPQCGTQLTFEASGPADELGITTSSLDDPSAAPPAEHTHTESRIGWLQTADGKPEHLQNRRP